ncbi:Mor family transcriptional regulator [Paenibacillus sp. V4I3]|jgi:Mor family transcriptional regulator|uniref:Mor transcription activator domain-containing protein n=2 Tax=Paenibacillus TaxID=44249 RepID=A0ABX1Z2S2_9BACL|nr:MULTISPECIES: CD3324 family protein [Paenibacillus]MCY9666035.1 CD3324 family protein [Paenibacillus alginolyticus]MDQ0873396.1 Mor family transcriptional regulator [Paenibacillus sp. V4I3]MDQ0890672.1 Mor family transcriptional regulator [Paenibacillus sp. V4I9]MDQ0896617.1 Mor family transcriptional regulator [Paenibacillus sp. V4I7]MDQ0917276.1 Mor family transcriptional regulator [Paenibacillus sp. V4I5]
MSYKNGKDVLPPNLLKQLQEYIQGEIVYIPKKEQKRAGWGENNGTRIIIERRNREIFRLYQTGSTVMELIKVFHLSEDSIRKIIVKTRELTANQA